MKNNDENRVNEQKEHTHAHTLTHTRTHTHTHTHTQTHTHTHTKLHHLAREKSEGELLNPWGNTRKSWTHLAPSFPSLTSEKS